MREQRDRTKHSWTLSSTMTDLCIDKSGQVAHARFDPTVPKGITLHHRLTKVHQNMEQPSEEDLVASFENRSLRVKVNGLGFDLSRFGSLADDTDPLVDPVVEVLAFYGLNILPVRGPGRERHTASVQRGWLKWPLQDGSTSPRAFLWPAWPTTSGSTWDRCTPRRLGEFVQEFDLAAGVATSGSTHRVADCAVQAKRRIR